MDKKNVSDALYVLKAFGIFSVAAAHCVSNGGAIDRVLGICGTIGVPIFLVLSGVFFEHNYSILEFFIRKWKRIIVPWIVWGVGTYVLSVLSLGTDISLVGCVNWILGNRTWLYFVPVLLICMLILKIRCNCAFLCIVIGVSILSNTLTILGVFRNTQYLTNYQNVLNWILFFAIGIILRRKGITNWVPSGNRCILSFGILTIVLGIIYFYLPVIPSYWTWISVPFEVCAGITLYFLAFKMCKNQLLIGVGKNSYPIYFMHMQIGMIVANYICGDRLLMLEEDWSAIIYILKPVLVVMSVYVLIALIKKCAVFLNFQKMLWIVGM